MLCFCAGSRYKLFSLFTYFSFFWIFFHSFSCISVKGSNVQNAQGFSTILPSLTTCKPSYLYLAALYLLWLPLCILFFHSCLSILWLSLSCLSSVSTIVEEEVEDLYTDSSEDELNPTVQTPVVKHTILSWRRAYNFPSPENFRHFVESPFSPTHTEGKAFPKYVCCQFFQNFFFYLLLCIFLLGMVVFEN